MQLARLDIMFTVMKIEFAAPVNVINHPAPAGRPSKGGE